MNPRYTQGGDGGSGKGLVDVEGVGQDCVLFKANPQKPPPDEEMPVAISEVLQKWLKLEKIRVRATLPVVQHGHMIGLFLWFDRPAS